MARRRRDSLNGISTKIDYSSIDIEEIKKCVNSIEYFIENYVHIQNNVKGKMLFKLWDFQKSLLNEIHNNRYTIINKSRQLGISTLTSAYAFWLMFFRNDTKIISVSKDAESAKAIVSKIKFIYENLSSKIRINELITNNKTKIEFTNGSYIRAVSSNPQSARSESVTVLIIDEAAFIPKVEELWVSSQQTLANGGKCIVLSTPHKDGKWFRENWYAAKEGRSIFKPIELPWYVHPERDESWRKEQELILGKKMAAQECDARFVVSGNSVFEEETIERLRSNIAPPIEKRYQGDLHIFERPVYGRTYIVSCDVASGNSQDYSAIQVIDPEQCSQVAEYKGKPELDQFVDIIVQICKEYNNAFCVVERNGLGEGVLQFLKKKYNNLYYPPKNEFDTENLFKNLSEIPGFVTNEKTRPRVISMLIKFIINDLCLIRSERLVVELSELIWKQGKAVASSGQHDDLIMAFAIGLYIRDTFFYMKVLHEKEVKNSFDIMRKLNSKEVKYRQSKKISLLRTSMFARTLLEKIGIKSIEEYKEIIGG